MSEPSSSDSARSDSARSDSARSDSARSDSARSDSARSDSARSDSANSDPANSDPASSSNANSVRPFLKPVFGWIVASSLAFGVLAVGMDQVAKTLPVDSPGIPGLTDNVASPGAAGAPGTAASRSYPSPSFSLSSLEGRELGPQDFLGQVVVIDLWATWCGPCRMQAQFLDALHREYDGKGVQFLAVNSGEDTATVEAYVQRTPFP